MLGLEAPNLHTVENPHISFDFSKAQLQSSLGLWEIGSKTPMDT